MPTVELSRLTAIVATSDRPKSLRRLVQSLKRQYPRLRMLVADEGQEGVACKGIECLRLPAQVGRGAAHNALLARIRTPYFLMLDDRSELAKESQIERLLQLVAEDKLDLAAGAYLACERRLLFFVRRRSMSKHGIFEIAGDQLTLRNGHRTVGEEYSWCDIVPDFYVARTDKVRSLGGWEPELKNDGREEFFLRAHRHGLRIGVVPEVTLNYWNEHKSSKSLEQSPNMKSLAVAKMGLTRLTDFDGQVVKAPRRAKAA